MSGELSQQSQREMSEHSVFANIVPFQRIDELTYFYTSDSVKNNSVIDTVDLKDKKKFSEDVQGQWALEQIEAVLDVLRVRGFVIPKEKGGWEFPIISSREEYFNAHVEAKSKTLENIIDAQGAREAYVDVLKAKMRAAKGRRETLYQQLNENSEEGIGLDEDNSEKVEEVNEEFAAAYSKWNKEQQAQSDDLLRQESIIDGCRKQGHKQHDEDTDAVNRLQSALFLLKKFIQSLIKKFAFIEDVVRKKRDDGIDPYDDNDMRSCYGNLLDRFRQSDEMGILTTIMSGMAEKQGNKTMSAFMLCVEDWHQTMIRLGVVSITMDDLAAIITLKGLEEKNRIEFLQQENVLELTLDTLDNDEDYEGEEGVTSISGKKEKKSLLSRVKKFIQQDKTKKLINQRLSGGSGISTSQETRKEAERVLKEAQREAQSVFIATVGEGNRNGASSTLCWNFEKDGKCRLGDKCRFKHDDSKQNKKTGKGECYSWRDTKSCVRGDSCRFKHDSGTPDEVVDAVIKDKPGDNSKKQKEKSNAKVTDKLFSIDDEGDSWGNKKEVVTCILTSLENENVMSVNATQSKDTLGWDTLASIHVSKDKAQLSNLVETQSQKSATGMGGTLPITHCGYNSQFDLHMHVIEGGQTPNIKSVGKSLQTDGDGQEYVAIFTAKGATQMALNRRSKLQIMQILNEAEENDNIVGTAIQRNGVYEESFGEESDYTPSEEEKAFAVTSMYTSRVPMSSADDVIGMLVSACVKEEHLIQGIQENSIKGLPECVTVDAVKSYFANYGKDEDIIKAEIANAPLKTPIDYEKEVFVNPGEHLQMDNVDPSFARIKGEKTPVRSVGGYRDAVVAVDNCGYSVVHGRERKKDPHLVVKRFLEMWAVKWNTLKKLSADKEFITVETKDLCEKSGIRMRQAVPYDHRRGLGASEGLNRWLQDCAQAHMNRLTVYVSLGLINEYDKRSLWFHALSYANDVKLLAPSKTDHKKTQFEEGEKMKFNFSLHVVLPFGLRVVIRKKQGDQDGRGIDGVYVGFSKVVAGGILVYVFSTKRVVQKYTFIPREPMRTLSDVDCEYAALALYGDLRLTTEATKIKSEIITLDSPGMSKVGGDEHLNEKEDSPGMSKVGGEVYKDPDKHNKTNHEKSVLTGGKCKDKKLKNKCIPPSNPHRTRSKTIREKVLVVSADKPPKPRLPTRREARKSDRWMAAYRREIVKINEEDTLISLKKDDKGRYIRPKDAVVMRLLAILEWKWKPDPITGIEGWLECVRLVCDGSADKRVGEITYAETPDRTLLFLMAGIEATLGIRSKVGDAIRAYLNAPSLDKNLVVIADEDMMDGEGNECLSKESLLLKGLYGTTKGALSFQTWADMKLSEIGYHKCDIARGVYLKAVYEELVRLYRHSDDFKISAKNDEVLNNEIRAIQGKIRTTPFQKFSDFLGCHFVRYASATMLEDDLGDIYLATMKPQIKKLEVDFGYLIKHYNPTGRVRYTPLPLKPILDDADLNDVQKEVLSDADTHLYMSLVMSIGWIVGNIRPNLKYSHHVIAKKLSCPRVWDMYLAVWVLEHVILTADWPLIIGGPTVDPRVYTDASFATMEERRTVGGHGLVTCEKSGVIHAQVKTYKVAIKSIWEGETMAASEGQDTEIYANRVVDELQYPSEGGNKVFVDNTGAIDWMLGSTPTKRSKHVEVRMYRSRHLVADGSIVMEHVPTVDNIADILTKSLPRGQYERLAKLMLGHELVAEELKFWELGT